MRLFDPRWQRWGLAGSLLVNLFLAGFLVTLLLPGLKPGAARFSLPGWGQILPKDFLADLPDDRRREVLSGLAAYRAAGRQDRQALRQALTALADALVAEPYDPEATARVLAALRDRGGGMLQRGTDFMTGVLGRLTADERARLAAQLRRKASPPASPG